VGWGAPTALTYFLTHLQVPSSKPGARLQIAGATASLLAGRPAFCFAGTQSPEEPGSGQGLRCRSPCLLSRRRPPTRATQLGIPGCCQLLLGLCDSKNATFCRF
jgi:hypothetical protein